MASSFRIQKLMFSLAILGSLGSLNGTNILPSLDSIQLVNVPKTRSAETCQAFVKNAQQTLQHVLCFNTPQEGVLNLPNPIPSYVESYHTIVEQFNKIMTVMAQTIRAASDALSPSTKEMLMQRIEENLLQIANYIDHPENSINLISTQETSTEESELVDTVSRKAFQLVEQARYTAQQAARNDEQQRMDILERTLLNNIQSMKQHFKTPSHKVELLEVVEDNPKGTDLVSRINLALKDVMQANDSERDQKENFVVGSGSKPSNELHLNELFFEKPGSEETSNNQLETSNVNVEPSVMSEEEEFSIKPERPLEPKVSTGLEESVGTDDSKDETHLSEPFFGTPGNEEESNSESEASSMLEGEQVSIEPEISKELETSAEPHALVETSTSTDPTASADRNSALLPQTHMNFEELVIYEAGSVAESEDSTIVFRQNGEEEEVHESFLDLD